MLDSRGLFDDGTKEREAGKTLGRAISWPVYAPQDTVLMKMTYMQCLQDTVLRGITPMKYRQDSVLTVTTYMKQLRDTVLTVTTYVKYFQDTVLTVVGYNTPDRYRSFRIIILPAVTS
ncbi:MAG: hypothetical protein ACQER7_09885 [Bacteroidota bacterium]